MVEIYNGGYSLVKRSGVGQAILHQCGILGKMNIQATGDYQSGEKIVHINTIFPDSVSEAKRAKKRGQKVVYYAHSTQEDFKNSFIGSNALSLLFRVWIKHCYNKGDVIITPTEYSKKLLLAYGIKKPVYVLSNGVDTDYFTPNLLARKALRDKLNFREDEKVIISVGHYIERKGIIEFIETAKRLPQVKFLWYGYTAKRLVKRKVKKAMKSAPENVYFMGFTDQSGLREAYQGADAFLFLSKEETEGIVVLEALACKTPVIVSDIPVYDGWLTDKDSVFKVKDVNQAVSGIKNLFKNDTSDLTAKGRLIAEEHNYEMLGKQLLHIYELEGLTEKQS
ncbi:MAG: glycosyltransferase [Clostridia bacterium]|nr:glycosyltransferase [Clostridia bacterium]